MTVSPYADAFAAYWNAGWRGIVPLPLGKKQHPPAGYTGSAGVDPSYADCHAWSEQQPQNIALRLPANVIGIDVDAYGDKLGAVAIAAAADKYGALPATWRATSRDDGVSGILLYRVPEGLAWPGELGDGVEILQRRHRYAVVWPSLHPEGRTYRWIGPDGLDAAGVPDVDELAMLPDSWVTGLTHGELAADVARDSAGEGDAMLWIAKRPSAAEQPCRRMGKVVEQMRRDLRGSAHSAGRDAALRAVRLGDEGHAGVVTVVNQCRQMFYDEVTDPDRLIARKRRRDPREAAREWTDLLVSAVNLVTANPSGVLTCDCDGQITGGIVDPVQSGDDIDAAAVAADDRHTRMRDGASFILDAPVDVPAIWGFGDEVIWSKGESLMIVGPPGVGKTTLVGQVLRGLLYGEAVLGYGVKARGRVLYLAMDRPQQIARALRRVFTEDDRDTLSDRLKVWEGPPPRDIAASPEVLLGLVRLAEADTVIIDSVKDAAVGLTEDEVGAAYNRARQTCLANGIEVAELHHMTKRGPAGSKPTDLAAVYGSAWLTAGAGSVVLLWGQAGEPLVQWKHLKQPAAEVGPFDISHDHAAGRSDVRNKVDVSAVLVANRKNGLTARLLAQALFDTDKPSEGQIENARYRLRKAVKDGQATCKESGQAKLYYPRQPQNAILGALPDQPQTTPDTGATQARIQPQTKPQKPQTHSGGQTPETSPPLDRGDAGLGRQDEEDGDDYDADAWLTA